MPSGNDNHSDFIGPDYHRQVIILILSLWLVRIAFLLLSPYNLHGDEAQYWAWSKDLDWGYFTKPPGIAAVIAITTSIFGDMEWAVRLGAPILHGITTYVIYRTARHLYSGATGFWAACFYILMPGIWYSSNIISTDVPLLLCFAIALNGWVHLRESGHWRHATQLGVALGLGILCKYAMLFFMPALGVLILLDPGTRRALLSLKGLWIIVLTLAWVTPNIIWNMEHDFATLTHTAANADIKDGLPFHPTQFLEFFIGQFIVFGPLSLTLLGLSLNAAFRKRLMEPAFYLALFVLSPLVIIGVQALISRADLNWAATAYVPGAILTAHYGVKNWPKYRKWVGHNLVIQSALCVLVFSLYAFPSAVDAMGRANDVKRLRGWPDTVTALSDILVKGHEGNNFAAIAVDKRRYFYALNYYNMNETAPLRMWMLKSKPYNNHAEITHPLEAGPGPFLIVNYETEPEYEQALKEDFGRLERSVFVRTLAAVNLEALSCGSAMTIRRPQPARLNSSP